MNPSTDDRSPSTVLRSGRRGGGGLCACPAKRMAHHRRRGAGLRGGVRRSTWARHAISVSSATAGLHLALEAAGVSAGGPRDHDALHLHELSRGHPLSRRGPALRGRPARRPAISTLRRSPGPCGRSRDDIRAILPVHIGGHPCAMTEISEIGERATCRWWKTPHTPFPPARRPRAGHLGQSAASTASTRRRRSPPAKAGWSSPTTTARTPDLGHAAARHRSGSVGPLHVLRALVAVRGGRGRVTSTTCPIFSRDRRVYSSEGERFLGQTPRDRVATWICSVIGLPRPAGREQRKLVAPLRSDSPRTLSIGRDEFIELLAERGRRHERSLHPPARHAVLPRPL